MLTEFSGNLIHQLLYLVVIFLSIIFFTFVYSRSISTKVDIFDEILLKGNIASIIEISGVYFSFLLISNFSLNEEPAKSLILDIEALIIKVVVLITIFILTRLISAKIISGYFKERVDKQGDKVNYDNEIFKQQNIAASLFSLCLTIIFTFGIVELDIVNSTGYQLNFLINAIGIIGLGILFIFFHSFFILGKKYNILEETFIDNNQAAGLSLLGTISGLMYATHLFVQQLNIEEHIFSDNVMVLKSLSLTLAFFILTKYLISGLISLIKKVNYHQTLVEKHITSAGIFDGVINFLIIYFWSMVTLS